MFEANKYTLKMKSLTQGFKITKQPFTHSTDSQHDTTEQTTCLLPFPEENARTDYINSGMKTGFALR